MRHSARLRLNLCYEYYCIFHALYHLISVSSLSSRLVVFFFIVTPNFRSLFLLSPLREADLLTEISFNAFQCFKKQKIDVATHLLQFKFTFEPSELASSLSLSLIHARAALLLSLSLSLSLSLFQAEEKKSHLSLRLRLRAFFSTRGAQKEGRVIPL